MKTLGEKLVAARNAQNLTQEQLASRINVARTTIPLLLASVKGSIQAKVVHASQGTV